MAEVISALAAEKLAGQPRAFDRSELREQLSYATRAAEFADVVREAIERRSRRRR